MQDKNIDIKILKPIIVIFVIVVGLLMIGCVYSSVYFINKSIEFEKEQKIINLKQQ